MMMIAMLADGNERAILNIWEKTHTHTGHKNAHARQPRCCVREWTMDMEVQHAREWMSARKSGAVAYI